MPPDEGRADGQRPAGIVPELSHPAHDQYLPSTRRVPAGRDRASVDKGVFIAKIGGGNVQLDHRPLRLFRAAKGT